MKPTQEILERIRDLAGLREFRTSIWVSNSVDGIIRNIQIKSPVVFDSFLDQKLGKLHIDSNSFVPTELQPTVQLNDLLRVIDKQKGGKTISIGLYSDGKLSVIDYSDTQEDNSKECEYNLTLTVEQNLETNPDLHSLISNLIF